MDEIELGKWCDAIENQLIARKDKCRGAKGELETQATGLAGMRTGRAAVGNQMLSNETALAEIADLGSGTIATILKAQRATIITRFEALEAEVEGAVTSLGTITEF